MKRHLSVLACLVLVVAFVFSLVSCDVFNSIFGKPEEKPAPEHKHSFVEGKCECGEPDPNYKPDENKPHVNAVALGDNKFVVTAELITAGYEIFTLDVAKAGTYTITAEGGIKAMIYTDDIATGDFAIEDGILSGESWSNSVEGKAILQPGSYKIGIFYYSVETAGEYNVNLSYSSDMKYYVVSEEMVMGEGIVQYTAFNLTFKDNNVVVIENIRANDTKTWTYTMGEDGVATFVDENGDNPSSDYITYSLTFEDGIPTTLEWEGFEWPISAEPANDQGGEGGEGGDDEGGDDEGGADIVADAYIEDEISNTVSITDEMIAAGQAIFSFVPSYTGEYMFSSRLLYVDGVKDSKGNTVETNDSGYYELTESSTYYVFVPLASMIAGEYSITPEYQYPEGYYKNPFYFGWDYENGSDIIVNYAGNWTPVWYSYTPDADGTITLSSDTEHAIFNIGGFDYEPTTSLSVMGGNTYMIGIASNYEDDNFNNPAREITFSLNFEEGEYVGNGTQITPNVLTIGTNSAVSDYCTSTYFIYKATANGVLTIDCAQELFVLQFDGQYIDEDAINGNSLHVYDGGIYYVIVSVDDWMNYVEYEFTASFKADPVEAWFEDTLVTDGSAANAIVIPDNSYVVIGVGQGTYTISWDVADAILVNPDTNAPYVNGSNITNEGWWLPVKIYLPDYAAGTVNVTISKVKEEAPATDLTLGNNNIEQKDYKYVYTATEDGELTLNVTFAMMGSVVITYTINDGEAQTFFDTATMSTPCNTVIALTAGDKIVIDVVAAGYATLQASFAVPPTEVAGTLAVGANTFTLEANTYVLIPLQVMGLYEITWENAIVEYKESGRAPFVKISSGAVANLNPMAGAQLKVYLENYAAGTATINVAEYVDTPVDAVVGNNTVKVVDTSFGKVVNLPVSDAEVTYVVTPGNNAVVVYEYENFFDAVEITVAAGATVSFNVCTENFAAAEVVVTVAIKGAESEDSGVVVYVKDHTESGTKVKLTVTNATLTSGNVTIWRLSSWGSESTYECIYTVDANGVGTLAPATEGGGTPYGGVLKVNPDGTLYSYTYSGTEYILEIEA